MPELLNFLLPLQSVAIFNVLSLSYSSRGSKTLSMAFQYSAPFVQSHFLGIHQEPASSFSFQQTWQMCLGFSLLQSMSQFYTIFSYTKLTTREGNLFFLKQKQMTHFVRLRSYNYDDKFWNPQSDKSSLYVLFLLLLSLLFLKTQVKHFTCAENMLS